jgi:hypothetical protein
LSPADYLRLPFRWQFDPVRNEADGSIEWTWTAYAQNGKVAMQSSQRFPTLTECKADAARQGFTDAGS